MVIILLSTEATAGDTFNTHAIYRAWTGWPSLLSRDRQWILHLKCLPGLLWLHHCGLQSLITFLRLRVFHLSLDRFSGVVVYHARFSAQTLFLEIGCYYLLSPRAWHRRKLLLWLLALPSKPFCLNPWNYIPDRKSWILKTSPTIGATKCSAARNGKTTWGCSYKLSRNHY